HVIQKVKNEIYFLLVFGAAALAAHKSSPFFLVQWRSASLWLQSLLEHTAPCPISVSHLILSCGIRCKLCRDYVFALYEAEIEIRACACLDLCIHVVELVHILGTPDLEQPLVVIGSKDHRFFFIQLYKPVRAVDALEHLQQILARDLSLVPQPIHRVITLAGRAYNEKGTVGRGR